MKQSPARLQFEARGTCGRHFQTSWQRLLVHDPERAVLAGRSLGSDIYTSLDVKIGALAKSYFDGILEIRGRGLFYGHA